MASFKNNLKAFAFVRKSFFEELQKLFWTANQFIEFPDDLHSSFWIFKTRSQSLQVEQIPFSSITDLFVRKSISFSRDRTRCSNPVLTSSWTLPQISSVFFELDCYLKNRKCWQIQNNVVFVILSLNKYYTSIIP